jgi:cytidylate kinase
MISIAIDGPSGAGKSTLAKRLAKELGFVYVDTGAIYRTIAYFIYSAGISPDDQQAVVAALPDIQVELRYGDDGLQHMLLGGTDVTREIRLPEISLYASKVSAYPEVRAFLLEMQRQLARTHNVIMDGRDIGTVVLPNADIKIFLTASPEARARRRWKELEERGTPAPLEQVLREIEERDAHDIQRETAPLRQADDAVLVDTTELDFQGSFEALLALIRKRMDA